MTVLHTLSRTALLGTALGLTLGGCAMGSVDAVARANHAAAGSVRSSAFVVHNQVASTGPRYASLETPSVQTDASSPVVRKGTVLWRRMGDDAPPAAAEPQVSEELKRLREAVEHMQGQTYEQITALQSKVEQQQQELRQQTTTASSVASLAEESLRAMREANATSTRNWQQSNQQLSQLEQRLQTALTEVQARQLAADQRTQSYTDLKISQASLQTQLEAVREARRAAGEAEQRVASQLAAAEQVQNARYAAVSSQLAANQRLTETQLAELRKVNAENRALASSETASVGEALRVYADQQLAQARAASQEALAQMAAATNQNFAALDQRTNQRMGVLWSAANRQAEKLAEEKANAVAASVAALQQQTAAQKIEPAQIRAIAEQTVAESTPEFRALALQTLKEGQDYIRSVARSAVQDKDPGMTAALADAARDVITRDDKVVFAIRKAVADELQGLVTGADTEQPATGARTTLGPDHTLGEAEQLDPNRLRIAQLLAPEGGLARDAAQRGAFTDAQLAALSPAAGNEGGAVLGGQQSWSAQGTSLMRGRNRADWMDIRQYKVVVHQDNQTLESLLAGVLKHAEPFTGPWQIRWKISDQNRDLMTEKFSLDAEAPFEEFVSYLAQYIVNDRGVKLSVSLFDNERIIVISD